MFAVAMKNLPSIYTSMKDTESTVQTDAPTVGQPRMVSVDALRGFDMFWIIGGEQVAEAMEKIGGGTVLTAFTQQLRHVDWEGFRFYDGIFPLFLFLIGVSIVLSMDRTIAKSGRKAAVGRIVKRSMMLFAVGVFYYGGVTRAWPDIQLAGVLPRIALCYLIAALCYVLLPRKGIMLTAAACLAGYWAMMTFVPFPDVNLAHGTTGKKSSQREAKSPAELLGGATASVSGTFEEGRNLAHYVDFRCLPGKKRNLYYTNEGLLSTIPAVATTLLGIMAGWLLVSTRLSDKQKVIWLIGAGVLSIALGLLWGLQFPVIKRIWTSSFCLVSAGFSAILLGSFYFVIDVCRWQKWCGPFLWIGANSLAVYLVVNLVDFNAIALRFAGGNIQGYLDAHVATGVGGLLIAVVSLMLPVLFVRFLYQARIFIRL